MKPAYKDCISDAHIGECRKLSHNVRAVDETAAYRDALFKHRPVVRVPNEKRRPCVAKRIKKLSKYVKRAWNGYRFGKVIKP